MAFGADLVLAAAEGVNNLQIARRLRPARPKVAKMLQRSHAHGPHGLHDEVRSGDPRTVREQQVLEIVHRTSHARPVDVTHSSTRAMA